MKKIILTFVLSICSITCFAIPTVNEVKMAMDQKDYTKAESLLSEVLHEKPNNAPAHFYYSLVLSQKGEYQNAYKELQTVEKLDSNISFLNKDHYKSYKEHLTKRLEQEKHMGQQINKTIENKQTITSIEKTQQQVETGYTTVDIGYLAFSSLFFLIAFAVGLKKKADINNTVSEKQHKYQSQQNS